MNRGMVLSVLDIRKIISGWYLERYGMLPADVIWLSDGFVLIKESDEDKEEKEAISG